MEIKKTTDIQLSHGAGSGNRTHLSTLEGWSITDIRYPHIHFLLSSSQQFKLYCY